MHFRNFSRLALAIIFIFLTVKTVNTMQPPPPPLDFQMLSHLVTQADIIVVGKVVHVKKMDKINGTEQKITSEAVVNIEEILKGSFSDPTIVITESYSASDQKKMRQQESLAIIPGLLPLLRPAQAPITAHITKAID
ncbi:MAG: hypothetical protein K9N21_01670 [Deltaproteobacteria bacterium]|nr:hypothetical protein [Deltaproteobacteria bacterium]